MERPDFFTLKNGEKAKLPFSNEEYNQRLNKLRSIMDKDNLDMIILTSMHNIAYYSGFIYCSFGRPYGCIITENKIVTISANIDASQPWRRSHCENIIYTDWKKDNFLKAITSIIDENKIPKNIGIENDHITLEMNEKIQSIFSASAFTDISKKLMKLRMIKSKEEIEIIKNGARIADIGGEEIVKNIKDMNWLVDGDRVLVIAENVKTGSLLADNVLRFPTWGSTGNEVSNQTSWNQASIGSGWTGAVDNGYETSTLLYGEKIKVKGEMYHIPGGTLRQMNWDACCKIYSNNACPVANNLSFTIDEDTGLANTVNVSDDGYGGYGLTYTVVQQPNNAKTFTFDAATGAFTLTPDNNFFGTITFTYQANDGYCDSNVATVTVTVNAVDDAPVWTSTDPVTANTYPTLTGGDTWTYNWTVADVDTPCGNLTFPSQTIPSWLTFTNNGDCTGTLTGTLNSQHILPSTDDTYNLGSASKRWANIYTNDLRLSNEGKSNDVDGTWGSYIIQEGESDLFLINNRNGKKYKFNLTEVL